MSRWWEKMTQRDGLESLERYDHWLDNGIIEITDKTSTGKRG